MSASDPLPVSPTAAADLPAFMDAWNPVLVKELRQALHRRHSLVAFGLLVFSLWLGNVILILAPRIVQTWFRNDVLNPAYGHLGQLSMAGTLLVLVALNWLWLPLAAFHTFAEEHYDGAAEFLRLSPLTLEQIIRGKRLIIYGQCLLMASVAVPFLCLAYLLGGVGVVMIGFIMILGSLVTAPLVEIGLAMGAAATSTVWRIALQILLTAGCCLVALPMWSLSMAVLMTSPNIASLWVFLATGTVVSVIATVFAGAMSYAMAYSIRPTPPLYRPLRVLEFDLPSLTDAMRRSVDLGDQLLERCQSFQVQSLTRAILARDPEITATIRHSAMLLTGVMLGAGKSNRFGMPVTLPHLEAQRFEVATRFRPVAKFLDISQYELIQIEGDQLIPVYDPVRKSTLSLAEIHVFREAAWNLWQVCLREAPPVNQAAKLSTSVAG